VVKRWRDDGVKTHVLAVVEAGTLQNRLDAYSVGADDCLIRPFAVEELIARLRTISGTDQAKTHTLVVGDLEIDMAGRQVHRAGRTIALTAREYALLEFLAENRGKPVSRAKIREHLYDDDIPHRSNVVDVYIRYLRRKIDTGYAQSLIITCRGEGYMLNDPEA
jgi:DNA-binding response OmpR family regulator